MLGNTKWPCFLRRRRRPHSDSFSRELLKLSLKKNCRNRAQQPKRALLAHPLPAPLNARLRLELPRAAPTARRLPGPARLRAATHLPRAAAAPAPTPGPSRGPLLLLRPPPPRRPDARGAARLGRLPAGRRREGHRAPSGSGGEEITKAAGGEEGGTSRRWGGGSRPDRCPAAARRASGGEAVTARGCCDLQAVVSAPRRVCVVRLAVAAVMRWGRAVAPRFVPLLLGLVSQRVALGLRRPAVGLRVSLQFGKLSPLWHHHPQVCDVSFVTPQCLGLCRLLSCL